MKQEMGILEMEMRAMNEFLKVESFTAQKYSPDEQLPKINAFVV